MLPELSMTNSTSTFLHGAGTGSMGGVGPGFPGSLLTLAALPSSPSMREGEQLAVRRPADTSSGATAPRTALLWDLPVRRAGIPDRVDCIISLLAYAQK